jgi:hypothetical protein
MIIRATSKLLNISGIKPVKQEYISDKAFPGEWYAGILKTGKPGKLVIHFLHNTTKVSILCPTKSLNNALTLLPERVSNFLGRHGFKHLYEMYGLNTPVEIYATDSRSMLAYMNQLRFNMEYHLEQAETYETIDFKWIEDIHTDYLFSTGDKKKKYVSTIDLLNSVWRTNT